MNDLKSLDEHEQINRRLILQEDIDFWQDKLLELKLKKVKEDLEYSKKKKNSELEFIRVTERNSNLTQEIDSLNLKVQEMGNADRESKVKINQIEAEIKEYEEMNSNLHFEFLQKVGNLKNMENPENLMRHILQFSPEVLKNLCINLNKLQHEKMNYFMNMQKQFYSQMYYNQNMQNMQMPVQNMQNMQMPMAYHPMMMNNQQGPTEERGLNE